MGTIVYPNAKINIGLYITEKRPDGYHNLETVFLPVPWHDILEFTPATETTCTVTGVEIAGDANDNLCLKAYRLLQKHYPTIPHYSMHLHKQIPTGAGLGGGSADASFVLSTLNQLLQLNITEETLLAYALELGSDCPFFIYNKPSLAFSRGEQLKPISLPLATYQLLIVNPGVHVPTGWAFAQITPQAAPENWWNLLAENPQNWSQQIHNQFQQSIAKAHPIIQQLINQLYAQGAVYASMSGSGSTVYALFEPNATVETQPYKSFVHKLLQLP